MGNVASNMYIEGRKPPTVPEKNEEPTFDPHFGFQGDRQERVSKISLQEMKALRMKKSDRGYCAHFLKDYLVCYNYYKPVYGLCNPEFHAYEHCKMEDYVLRMKEYEREKRLRIRAEKLKEREKQQESS